MVKGCGRIQLIGSAMILTKNLTAQMLLAFGKRRITHVFHVSELPCAQDRAAGILAGGVMNVDLSQIALSSTGITRLLRDMEWMYGH